MKHNFNDLINNNDITSPNADPKKPPQIEVEPVDEFPVPDFGSVSVEVEPTELPNPSPNSNVIESPSIPKDSIDRVNKFKNLKSGKKKRLIVQTSSINPEPVDGSSSEEPSAKNEGVKFKPVLNLEINEDIIEQISDTAVEPSKEEPKAPSIPLFRPSIKVVNKPIEPVVTEPVTTEDVEPTIKEDTLPVPPVVEVEPTPTPTPVEVEVEIDTETNVNKVVPVEDPIEEILEETESEKQGFNPNLVLDHSDEVKVETVSSNKQKTSEQKKTKKVKRPSQFASFLADLDLKKSIGVFLVGLTIVVFIAIVFIMSSGSSIYKDASNAEDNSTVANSSSKNGIVQTTVSEQFKLEDEVSLKQKKALNQGLPLNYYTLLESIPNHSEKSGVGYTVSNIYISLNPNSVKTASYNGREYSKNAAFLTLSTSKKLSLEEESMLRGIVSSLLENKDKKFFKNKEAVVNFLKIPLESPFKGINIEFVDFKANE